MPKMNAGTLEVGQIFHGRYEIVRCLKTGGMGAVYECIHLKTRKRRALKVMLPEIVADPSMHERFELEARVTADIESEHIVETFDAGVDEETGAPFLVMELLRGEELGSLLKRRGALPAEEVVLLLAQAARALDRTHAAGIVHRDLKPDNFFVTTRDDDTPRLKILDFGIAKVIADRSGAVQQTAAIGTPLYMSPEQFQGDGKIGPRADIYALGHIAYALLTGRPYWHDEQRSNPAVFAFFVLVMNGPHELPTARAARRGVALPRSIDTWFAKATAMRPSDRYDRASTLVTELASVLGVSSPRFSMASMPSFSSGVRAVSVKEPVTEVSSSVPTKRDAKSARTAPTVPERKPAAELERTSVSSLSDLPSGSTASIPPRPRSKLRFLFIAPVTILVLGIGVTALSRTFGADLSSHGSPDPSPPERSLSGSNARAHDAATAELLHASPDAPPPPPSVAPMASTGVMPSVAPVPITTVQPPAGPSKTLNVVPPPRSGVEDDGLYGNQPSPPPPPPPPPPPDCDPPYTVDADGHRHMKLECP